MIAVTGEWLDASGSPCAGTVTFQLVRAMQDTSDKIIVPSTSIEATLDVDGKISQNLYANDDTTTEPLSSMYSVEENITGTSAPKTYNVVIPHAAAGATIDLAQLAPAGNA